MIAEVASQYAEIERYAAEGFAHAARTRAAGKHREIVEASPVPPEIEQWVVYLLTLERRVAQCPAILLQLSADTVEGLAAVERARARFQRAHRQCGRCAAWVPALAYRCICGMKFER